MQQRRFEAILEDCYQTVWAIAASPYCHEFIIGLTQQPLRSRRYQYISSIANPYQHMVLLCDRLDQPVAKKLEAALQTRVWVAKEGKSALGKYNKNKMVVRGSTGGVPLSKDVNTYSVYMTWLER